MTKYRCPRCASTNLGVFVTVFARLSQDEDDNFETDAVGEHDWTEDSDACCLSCHWQGTMWDCNTKDNHQGEAK